jgi:hypothetical protein
MGTWALKMLALNFRLMFFLGNIRLEEPLHWQSLASLALCRTAPEEIQGQPMGIPGDWWRFGLLAFQILAGKLPFEEGPSISHVVDQIPDSLIKYYLAKDGNPSGFIIFLS